MARGWLAVLTEELGGGGWHFSSVSLISLLMAIIISALYPQLLDRLYMYIIYS